ncbi:response regulator [Larkinella sp. VNQ87]|uniref:response regulator n=1 Tax=Larkinella sp. VNQ87 TaxID=3400921 RepID=UPI003C0E2D09
MNRKPITRSRSLRQARILVIEDNPDQALIMENVIQQSFPDVQLIQASSSQQAIDFLQSSESCEWQLPQLIILDLYLPEREDGWQTLECIRQFKLPVSSIPVIMLSASSQPDDILEAYQRGSSCYLVKPLKFEQWLESFKALREYWWDTVNLPSVRYIF